MRRDRFFRKKKIFYTLKPSKRKTGVCALVLYTKTFERKNDYSFPFIWLIIVNIEGNESFTHTKQFIENEKFPARTRCYKKL